LTPDLARLLPFLAMARIMQVGGRVAFRADGLQQQ
jgi:hypothetical protein